MNVDYRGKNNLDLSTFIEFILRCSIIVDISSETLDICEISDSLSREITET